MNKRGQLGIILFIFLLLLFIIIWASWLGGFINTQVAIWLAESGSTGLEAFLISNLNLWIGLILLIVIAWSVLRGGGG